MRRTEEAAIRGVQATPPEAAHPAAARPGRRRLRRRVTAGLLAVATAGPLGAGMAPQPAQAAVSVYVSVAVSVAATFNVGGSHSAVLRAIEQAKREILAEVAASEERIVAELNRSEAAHVATCLMGSSQRLRNMDRVQPGDYAERINQANYVSDCANQAGQMSHTVSTLPIADYLGYATAEANAIATVMRAWAGLDLESQLAGYISHYFRLIDKLRPTCTARVSENERWWERVWTCTAFNGRSVSEMERRNASGSPGWLVGPVDVEALKVRAAVDTSYALAWEALPRLSQALAMVQRDFVVVAADPDPFVRNTRYWHEDGPLSWVPLDDGKTVTSLAATIEPSGRRHYLAVMDGRLWHRMRTRDGSWGAWADLGVAATVVTAAVDAQGQLHVSAIINGVTHHRIRAGEGTWTNFQAVPGRAGVATVLGSTVDPSGRLHLLSIVDGQLGHQLRHADGSWTGGSWGIAGTAVSAAAQADGQVHVAAVINGQVMHRMRQGEGIWTNFAPVTGLPPDARVATITSALDPAGNYQLLVAGDFNGLNGVLQKTRFPNGAWSQEWVRVGINNDFFDIQAVAAS